MLDCIVLGDSIAVGVHTQRPECISYAKGGINSWQWNKQFASNALTAGIVIISLGSNDHKGVKTQHELETLRAKVKASRVFWILPAGNSPNSGVSLEQIQSVVTLVAAQYGDVILPIKNVQKDGVHPSWAGYKNLADQTKVK